MNRTAALSLAILLTATLAWPQEREFNIKVPPPHHHPGPGLGAWWKNSDVVKELGLSDAQVKQIEQTFLDHRLKLIDLRAELERQEVRFQPLIDAEQPDEAKISAQLDAVLAARGRLEKAHAMMQLAIRRVLSVEQWKKLQSRHHQRDHFAPLPHPTRLLLRGEPFGGGLIQMAPEPAIPVPPPAPEEPELD
jgi:Spy/CpxP family protein refolding chaperone